MSEPNDSLSGWPAAGGSGDHPVLRDVAEAARLISDAEAFLSPTRSFDEPHLEESDWPRDLDGPETQAVLDHLADMAHSLSACVNGIRCQHNVPDLAKPELDGVADLLLDAGRKLSALTEAPEREVGSAGPARQSALNFPQAPLAGPAAAGDRPASSAAQSGPSVKPPKL